MRRGVRLGYEFRIALEIGENGIGEMDLDKLQRIDVVLVRSRYGGNIGSAARAIKNMGLGRLHLVAAEDFMQSEARMMAASAGDVLAAAEEHVNLEDALADFDLVLGVSRRVKSSRQRIMTPGEAARFAASQELPWRTAFVFGPEDSGLTAEDLSLCHGIVSIPSDDAYPSLNLAQAVMVVAYELRMSLDAGMTLVHSYKGSSEEEMDSVFVQVESVLDTTGFFVRNPRERVMLHLRAILTRGMENSRDSRIVRGIFRRIAWYLKQSGSTISGGE